MAGSEASRGGGVQSLGRALDVLETMQQRGGELALIEISGATGLPMPTIHRLVRTLVDRGYLRQLPDKRYALGTRLIPLGNAAQQVFGVQAAPQLTRIVDQLGETANLATLDGDMLVYVGQVPSPHAMRMFTELGRHVHAHCRAAGKVLLAELADDEVRNILRRAGMPARTPQTVTDPDELLRQVQRIRETGYAFEQGEMEIGVECVAVPIPSATMRLALSISAPTARMDEVVRERAVRVLRAAATSIASTLDASA
ncbi:IclR family transcriptional regulator [Calidifontibacter sp. DB0510]|uniref:Glycerol operon regulatory protein n=1 Tax=Metallococcus carri TaxID=1656884 RepID=A0A967EED3_9MICO|nr:IclR family transcriptional regulator [Metallococcus carri]NHN55561.1 IclR family transcriptional regulator [Metallococcus carri]NOP38255.1 IclR family transcriptional regulator [Calidifontibacter sp. DB2511S]